MTALRSIPDRECKHCKTLFRPRREEQRYCSRACWYDDVRENEAMCPICSREFKRSYAQQKYCSVDCKNVGVAADKRCICANCGKEFERVHGKARAYCSISCSNQARAKGMKACTPPLTPRPKNEVVRSTHGYSLVRVGGKKVLEHRLIMEQMLGRPLLPRERVHHKNGDRMDNRPENLELWVMKGGSKKDPSGQRMEDLLREFLIQPEVTDPIALETAFRRVFKL